MVKNITMGTVWTMLVGTAMAVVYMFNTFAKASDVKDSFDKIDYRMIKSDIREIREDLRGDDLSAEIRTIYETDLEDLINELCLIQPLDRECNDGFPE